VQHTKARMVVGQYLDENVSFLRALGVKHNVKIHRNVSVTIPLQWCSVLTSTMLCVCCRVLYPIFVLTCMLHRTDMYPSLH